MENNVQQQPNPQNQLKSNLIRNILISFIFLALILVLFWVVNSGAKGKQTTLDDVQEHLESGSVNKIEFSVKYIYVEYKDGSLYWIYNSNSVNSLLLKEIVSPDGAYHDMGIQVVLGSSTTFNILNFMYPILIIASLFLVFRMVMKQMANTNNKSFEFIKNRARILPSKIKFSDVAGADEEKAELEEIIEFFKAPDKFIKMGARIPKGVLLVGSPGTGKTLLAKACAGEANVPFFTISGSDFLELFVGVGASRVRDLFETAKKAKPCIVFIDEIDAIGRQRGAGMGGGNDEREQTLNQLLVQMDGFEANEGIIVLAATNRADILDPALLRPGRFDRRIFINVPDVKGREDILKVHIKNKPIDKDVNLKHVARITSGFTGADLENMLNEAALLAAKNKQTTINMENLNDAISKVTMGSQKRSYVITEKDKKITAVHESGHAIVGKCVKNSDPIHEVSIVPRGNAGGYTLSRPETDDRHVLKSKLEDLITMMLAGRTAEKLFLDDISTGASNDIERATSLARSMVTQWGMSEKVGLVHLGAESGEIFIGRDYATRPNYSEREAAIIDEEVKAIIEACAKKANDILTQNKSKLLTMVDVLLEKETIYQDEVEMIMSGKSAKEIIETIKEKNLKAEQDKKIKQEKEQEAAQKAQDSLRTLSEDVAVNIDELIKKAESRELELNTSKDKQDLEAKDSLVDEPKQKTKPSAIESKEAKVATQSKIAKPKTTTSASRAKPATVASKPKTTAKKVASKIDDTPVDKDTKK